MTHDYLVHSEWPLALPPTTAPGHGRYYPSGGRRGSQGTRFQGEKRASLSALCPANDYFDQLLNKKLVLKLACRRRRQSREKTGGGGGACEKRQVNTVV